MAGSATLTLTDNNMKELLKEAFEAGSAHGQEKENAIYWCNEYQQTNEALKDWLIARLDKCLPCDANVRVELEELIKTL